MTTKEIFKIIKANKWKEEETPGSNFLVVLYKTCYLESRNAYNKKVFSVCAYDISDSYMYEWSREDETRNACAWVMEKNKKDKSYFKKKEEKFNEVSWLIKKDFQKIKNYGLSGLSKNEMLALIEDLRQLGLKLFRYSAITEALDFLSIEDYAENLKNVSAVELPKIVPILTSPEKLGFFEQEKLNILRLAKMALEDEKMRKAVFERSFVDIEKDQKFSQALKKHTDSYFWIQNGYKKANYLDKNYFLNSVATELNRKTLNEINKEIDNLENKERLAKKKLKDLYEKYRITPDAKIFFQTIRDFSFLQDRRKENVLHLIYCLDQVLEEAGKRFNVSKKDLYFYPLKNLIGLFNGSEKMSKEELAKMNKVLYFSYFENDLIKTKVFYGKVAEKMKDAFKNKGKEMLSTGFLKGFVASAGKSGNIVRGRVKIVLDPENSHLQEGEILVTGMTRPEYVPLMKKAKAVITNEGGITTHAAIISRELKVPCIIGTKIATEVLQDGDLVEMNLKNGIIKILK
jgi:phosphohistidine swiveling domain-containing protein